MSESGQILWEASAARKSSSKMMKFMESLAKSGAIPKCDWDSLYKWSVSDLEGFWNATAAFTKLNLTKPATKTFQPPPSDASLKMRMVGGTWFLDATLNYAENLLCGADGCGDVIAYAEGAPRRHITADDLKQQVAACAVALAKIGVTKGDRVAGVVGNIPEAIIAMLATASLGAVWSSCSPDFGVEGVVDRLAQIEPKVVFYTAAYQYNGKLFDCQKAAAEYLGRIPGLDVAVAINHLTENIEKNPAVAGTTYRNFDWDQWLEDFKGAPLTFCPVGFSDPLFIMFSSGTTGVPKCIVHSVGGTILQHKKELMLHSDLGPEDRLLYFTTCGWMMWNWMVSALSLGTTLVLFEGSVSYPSLSTLWDVVGKETVTTLGTSPKFIGACMNAAVEPQQSLADCIPRTILSTGSPLLPEHFSWVYEKVGKDIHLASISGGTDIISCFMLGNPLLPVRAGEIQAAGLGMDIDVWDDQANPLRREKGELVCKSPFVSMPVGFWNDPSGKKFYEAYFDYYLEQGLEVWRHGDYVEMTDAGSIIVYGRSDATLNPGGVRIGTAEIYRQVETITEIADSIAVGHKTADDVEVVLFVKLNQDVQWGDALAQRIKQTIRKNLTPRHVPQWVFAVPDIPYTRSGKKVELAVVNTIHGKPVKNVSALANPESLEPYKKIAIETWG